MPAMAAIGRARVRLFYRFKKPATQRAFLRSLSGFAPPLSADDPGLRFTVMKSYRYIVVVNKQRPILWTTDESAAKSMLWSAHKCVTGAHIGRVFAGQLTAVFAGSRVIKNPRTANKEVVHVLIHRLSTGTENK